MCLPLCLDYECTEVNKWNGVNRLATLCAPFIAATSPIYTDDCYVPAFVVAMSSVFTHDERGN